MKTRSLNAHKANSVDKKLLQLLSDPVCAASPSVYMYSWGPCLALTCDSRGRKRRKEEGLDLSSALLVSPSHTEKPCPSKHQALFSLLLMKNMIRGDLSVRRQLSPLPNFRNVTSKGCRSVWTNKKEKGVRQR